VLFILYHHLSLISFVVSFFLGSLACFMLPAAIYLKLMPEDSPMYFKAKILLGFGILVMFLVVIFTILNLAGVF
jgi:glucose-6-phosphate-specific signal transduction histidine kinase